MLQNTSIPAARQIALEILFAVDVDGAYANLALARTLEKYNPMEKERAFVTELVYGTVKCLNTIDWILGKFTKRPIDKIPPWIRNILRLGVYQIFFLDRVPDSAACNESVNLAKKYGHHGIVGFVNGVLRNIIRQKGSIEFPDKERNPALFISLKYSHPLWLIEKWLKEFGFENTVQLCKYNNQPAPLILRTNFLKVTREQLQHLLEKEGLAVKPVEGVPEALIVESSFTVGHSELFHKGYFQVQDVSSLLVGHVVNPKSGEMIIDCSAAPGGKATHIAELMNNSGKVIAGDIHPHKIALIEENSKRLGIDIIETVLGDARTWLAKYPQKAQRVLLDAPCSGTGVLGRKPDSRWRKTPEQINVLPQLQFELLCAAAEAVAPNGTLVYSTCSLEKEENFAVIERFLTHYSNFRLTPVVKRIGFFDKLPNLLRKGWQQIYPFEHGVDGFFIAHMQRVGP